MLEIRGGWKEEGGSWHGVGHNYLIRVISYDGEEKRKIWAELGYAQNN